jgi:hypothetical protein
MDVRLCKSTAKKKKERKCKEFCFINYAGFSGYAWRGGALYHIPDVGTRARDLGDSYRMTGDKFFGDTLIEKFRFIGHL